MEVCLRDGEGQKEKCIQRGWPPLGPGKLLCENFHPRPEEDFLKCSILLQSPEATEPTPKLILAEERKF